MATTVWSCPGCLGRVSIAITADIYGHPLARRRQRRAGGGRADTAGPAADRLLDEAWVIIAARGYPIELKKDAAGQVGRPRREALTPEGLTLFR